MKRAEKAINDKLKKPKRWIWIAIIGTAVLLLVIGGIAAYRILYTPENLFSSSTMDPAMLAQQNATPIPTPAPEETDTAAPSQSVGPTSTAETDITQKNDIVNILLIGIDRSQTVGKLSGNDPHADVMMIVAVNFKKKKADLISLPRDTFIHAPEIMNGVYKLNASFNVGGGFNAKNGEGFLKVCQAAKYMLGGIPVDYYYAVDFTSLVNIIDTIGGVDYDVESRSYSHDGIKGKQHMNGVDVLFYVRSRKVGPEQGDANRVNRQKKMMVALFNQLTKNGKLTMLPDLINTANSGIYTNTTLQQTLALANFAKNIGADKIKMHSMAGRMIDKASWHYCFTYQEERKELIRKVYGIDVPEQVHCSIQYSDWLVDYGFCAIRYLKTAKQLLDYAKDRRVDFTAEQTKAYDALVASCANTQKAYDVASLTIARADTRAMGNARKELKTLSEQLSQLLDYKEKLMWTYNDSYWLDPAINEVLVDFR